MTRVGKKSDATSSAVTIARAGVFRWTSAYPASTDVIVAATTVSAVTSTLFLKFVDRPPPRALFEHEVVVGVERVDEVPAARCSAARHPAAT